MPSLDITDINEKKEEDPRLATFRSVLKLLYEKGVDLLTSAEATNDCDIIAFVNKVIKIKSFSKPNSSYGSSQLELFSHPPSSESEAKEIPFLEFSEDPTEKQNKMPLSGLDATNR